MQDVGYRMLDTGWMIVEFSLCSLRLTPLSDAGWMIQEAGQQTTSDR